MGLAQRRISQAFQTEQYPEWKNKLVDALGFDVPIEIKWESMLDDSYADKEQYFNWYAKVYFQPLIETFKNICQDDMGKEALKAALKKVIIDGTEGISYKATKFEGG
ncbi:MAG: hypothetical protein IT287_05930, partial [Bdellovibrionaceae bacterium]|nr:hypothetical protein [Pseudobdellovibrionaceae bacterium]